MLSEQSVSVWISQLKAGNHAAAQLLWDRYFPAMVRLARDRLQAFPRRAVDEEDVALSAFDSFCRGAENGRFPQLCDRDNLWPLLVVITARKVIDTRQHQTRKKRAPDGHPVQGESAWLDASDGSDHDGGIDLVVGHEPTPAFAAEVAEETRRWLECLDSDELRAVALWKMEGYANEEIAAKLGCVVRSVERRLEVIRKLLKKEMQG
jgi:DNA-directed RNA polymerase specialized sigma24 family protein